MTDEELSDVDNDSMEVLKVNGKSAAAQPYLKIQTAEARCLAR